MIRGINVNIHDLLKKSIELGASDIHITINSTPIARVKGSFVNLSETVLTKEHTQAMTREIAEASILSIAGPDNTACVQQA